MSHKKDLERSIKVREFQDDLKLLLSEEDSEYVQYALKEFSTYKNVRILVQALLSCLKTPESLDLLPVIRELLPKKEQKEYDRIAPYHKMAHPYQRLKQKKDAIKTIWLERSGRLPLGFSIRGGKEMGLGIFVSELDPQSPADNAGMRVGDQIIEVNGINFEWLSHSSAVKVFKTFSELKLVTYNCGRLPKIEQSGEVFRWIDPLGNPLDVNEQNDTESMSMDHPFSFADKKRIVINRRPGKSAGIKIRGGKEFKLGIFVVRVDEGSVAEEQGLKVGDQILMVNGISFKDILHEEAVSILKTHDVLMMSVQCVGRIPRLRTQYRKRGPRKDSKQESTDGPEDGKKANLPQRASFKDGLTESPKFSPKFKQGKNAGKKTPVSPLSTLDRKKKDESDSDVISLEDDEADNKSSKFQYGIGTGMMLSKTAHLPVKEQIINTANKLLSNEDEVSALVENLTEYEENEDVNALVNFLIMMLDTTEKLKLLDDIRSALKPQDLPKFDKRMSAHQVKTKKKRKKKEEEEEPEPSPVVLRPKKGNNKGTTSSSGKSLQEEEDDEPAPVSIKPRDRRRHSTAMEEDDDEEEDEEEEEPVPVSIKPTKKGKKRVVEEEEDDDEEPAPVSIKPTKKTSVAGPKKANRQSRNMEEEDEEEPAPVSIKPTKKTSVAGPKKANRQSRNMEEEEEDNEDEEEEPKPVSIKPAAKKPSPEPQKKEPTPEDKEFERKRQGIVVKASQIIKDMSELKAMDKNLKQYGANKDVDSLIKFLLTILNSPMKHSLFVAIRELIAEDQLDEYDKKVGKYLPPMRKKSGTGPAGANKPGGANKPTAATTTTAKTTQAQAKNPPAKSAASTSSLSSAAKTGQTKNVQQNQKPQPSKAATTATPITVTVQAESTAALSDNKPKNMDFIRQKIVVQASKVLKIKDELKGLERRLKQYEPDDGDVEFLVNFLLTIFDSPKKHPVLADVREFIKEKDLAKYDELTAKYIKKPEPAKTNEEKPKPINVPPPSNNPTDPGLIAGTIASEIKNRGGQSSLRKTNSDLMKKNGPPQKNGAFNDPAAQEVLQKAKKDSLVPQTRESFLAWNEEYSEAKNVDSPGKPLQLEIQKTAFTLGIELKEEDGGLYIDDVAEDGAAFNDGFLTSGFKILKVDDSSMSGLTVADAEQLLNEKYDSDKPSISFLVVPPA